MSFLKKTVTVNVWALLVGFIVVAMFVYPIKSENTVKTTDTQTLEFLPTQAAIQRSINRFDYGIPVDGVCGKETRDAWEMALFDQAQQNEASEVFESLADN